MKALVTGGAGFIGSHLVDALIERGDRVIVIDNLSTGKRENVNPKAEFHELDIRNFNDISSLFKGIDDVFHLAARPRVPFSVEHPYESHVNNALGTLNVLIASRDAKIKRFIYTSSSSVYGDQKKLPLKENMVPKPKSPYALQKFIGEEYCRLFYELYGLSSVSLRYFNVYGPRMPFEGAYALVIGIFLRQKKANEPLTIYGDGEQTRDFTHVKDIVSANILAAQSDKVGRGEVINIGSGKNCSINTIAKLIGGKTVMRPVRPGDARHTLADNARAKKLIGWRPEVDIKDGIEELKKIYL